MTIDGRVDQDDVDTVLFNYASVQPHDTGGDINGDGMVDQTDLDAVLVNFGVTCP